MDVRRLPVAPRPFRDETLSSWLGRVACRYGLGAPSLAAGLATPDDPFDASLSPIDDISPGLDRIALWARAGALDPARLRRMTLAERHPRRPLAWFLDAGPAAVQPAMPGPPSAVCLACFHADRTAGRDGYCRASWLLAERCVCPAHGRMVIDQCPNCHAHLRIAFRLRENRARPVCARCEGVLESRGGEGDGLMRDLAAALLAMQARIGAAVDHAPAHRAGLDKVIAALWSPLDDPGASGPVLALWASQRGWRAPVAARFAVGQPMPLPLLPVSVRALTLVAIRDLFGEEIPALAGARDRADWLFRRAAFPRPVRATLPRAQTARQEEARRPAADYRRLAAEILAHPDWAAAAHLPERRRQRVLGRLIDLALGPGLAADWTAKATVQRSAASPVQSFSAKSDASGAHPKPFQP